MESLRVTVRTVDKVEPEYTSDPKTIWKLAKDARADAFADIFRQASVRYWHAFEHDDTKAAQESALQAVSAITGLFPESEDPAHKLIAAFIAALIETRSGAKSHILLKAGLLVPGTKRGVGAAVIAAGGVAAVNVLCDRDMSKRGARVAVVQLLADNGYSRRRGDHGKPIPVTTSALRAWEEKSDENPLVAVLAPGIQEYLEGLIAERNLSTANEVVGLLSELTPNFLKEHRAL